jgi:VanZ family protein
VLVLVLVLVLALALALLPESQEPLQCVNSQARCQKTFHVWFEFTKSIAIVTTAMSTRVVALFITYAIRGPSRSSAAETGSKS